MALIAETHASVVTRGNRGWFGHGEDEEQPDFFHSVPDVIRDAVDVGVLQRSVDNGAAIFVECPDAHAAFIVCFALQRLAVLNDAAVELDAPIHRWFSEITQSGVAQTIDEVFFGRDDFRLMEATAGYISWRAGRRRSSTWLKILRQLVVETSDDYVRCQARVALADVCLAAAQDPRVAPGTFKRRAASWREEACHLLDEIANSPYPIPLPSLRSAIAARSRAMTGAWAAALACLRSETEPTDAEAAMAVIQLRRLVAEAGSARLKVRRRRLDEALRYARGISLADLSEPEQIDVLGQLIVISSAHLEFAKEDLERRLLVKARRNARRLGQDVTVSGGVTYDDPTVGVVEALWPLDTVPIPIATSWMSHLQVLYETTGSQQIGLILERVRSAYLSRVDASTQNIDAALARLNSMANVRRLTGEQYEDLRSALDDVERLIPKGHPRRAGLVADLGSLCSHIDGDLDLADRCVSYYEENLRCARRGHPEAPGLAWSYQNAAIAHNVRYRSNRVWKEKQANNPSDLTTAIRYARKALRLEVAAGAVDPRTQLTLSWMLYLAERDLGEHHHRSEAIAYQREALAAARELFTDDADEVADLAEMVFQVSGEEDPESPDLLLWAYEAAVRHRSTVVDSAVSCGADGVSYACSERRWAESIRIAEATLRAGTEASRWIETGARPPVLLQRVQGLSGLAAFAAIQLSNPGKAAELLERGAVVREREHLRGSRPEKQLIGRAAVLLDRWLIYLTSTAYGGFAVCVSPQGRVSSIPLPDLDQSRLADWLYRLVGTEGEPASRDDRAAFLRAPTGRQPASAASTGSPNGEILRAPRGLHAPSGQIVDEILADASRTVAALRELLVAKAVPEIHLIPVGAVSAIPWQHALARNGWEDGIVLTAPAASLLLGNPVSSPSNEPPAVIADPSPVRLGGRNFPALSWARKEAVWLEDRFGANTLSGPEATKSAFAESLMSATPFLHVATHADFEPDDWFGARLLWAAGQEGSDADSTTVGELTKVAADLVFLACCSAGAPSMTVPDEAFGFPTALLAHGARTVVAPLWPVGDRATHFLVNRFYVYWRENGLNVACALKKASDELHEQELRFRNSATWAAWVITGANQ